MRHIERAAIHRLLSDFIRSDGNLSPRDIQLINKSSQLYNPKSEVTVTLEDAINILKNTTEYLNYIDSLKELATSPERRRFLAAMTILTCGNLSSRSVIYSVENKGFHTMSGNQVLYIECEYDITTNRDITENYRLIMNEFSLIGLHFIYLPMVSKHITATYGFDELLMFLYPNISLDSARTAYHNLSSIKTADFCGTVINGKLNINQLQYCSPSIVTHICCTTIRGKRFDNYLVITLNNTLETIKATCDICRRFMSPIPAIHDTISYNGFYKYLFDNIMGRKGVRSRVGVDFQRAAIILPEANVTLSFLHRREKALYLLFAFESKSGGINFNKATTKETLDRYKQRMKTLKRKYKLIYKELGGSTDNTPNIELPEIRLPMISLIKRGLLQLSDTLDEVDNYIIKRNIFGNYIINLPPDMFAYLDDNTLRYKNISESTLWKKLKKM